MDLDVGSLGRVGVERRFRRLRLGTDADDLKRVGVSKDARVRAGLYQLHAGLPHKEITHVVFQTGPRVVLELVLQSACHTRGVALAPAVDIKDLNTQRLHMIRIDVLVLIDQGDEELRADGELRQLIAVDISKGHLGRVEVADLGLS